MAHDRDYEDMHNIDELLTGRVGSDGERRIPPERPTPEGMRGTDAGPEEMGERH